jgi:membrane protein involved in colicin uptake
MGLFGKKDADTQWFIGSKRVDHSVQRTLDRNQQKREEKAARQAAEKLQKIADAKQAKADAKEAAKLKAKHDAAIARHKRNHGVKL